MKYIIKFLPFIIIIIISSCKNNCEKENEKLKDQIADYQTEVSQKNNLIVEFNNKIDGFMEVNKELTYRQKQVDSLTNIIRKRGKATRNESDDLNKALEEINKFLEENEEMKSEFDSLNLDMNQTKIVEVLLDNIKAKKEEIRLLKEDINTLTSNISSLKIDNQNLKVQIDEEIKNKEQIKSKASELQIGSLVIELPKNKLKTVKKAKNIDKISFKVEILTNEFAEVGKKKLFIRIIKPNDSALYEKVSDYFISERHDKIQYTLYQEFNYNKQRKVINLTWEKAEKDLLPGKYEVILFIEGKQVKSKMFSLKK